MSDLVQGIILKTCLKMNKLTSIIKLFAARAVNKCFEVAAAYFTGYVFKLNAVSVCQLLSVIL